MKMRNLRFVWPALPLILVGCQAGVPETDDGLVGKSVPYKPAFSINAADAGVNMKAPGDDDKAWRAASMNTARRYGSARANPFLLTSSERNFETQQENARVFSNLGFFDAQFTPAQDPATAELQRAVVEPQPYRRLSGIIVGDSVTAIIELGQGQTEIIRPGMRIPNSPWRVKSIDANKATLVRSGNVLPKEITVRLESPPPGMQPSAPGGGRPGGFPGGPGGFPGAPGGFPGGRPGGMPGAPGGFPGGGAGFPGGPDE